jgi:hypothetical protein
MRKYITETLALLFLLLGLSIAGVLLVDFLQGRARSEVFTGVVEKRTVNVAAPYFVQIDQILVKEKEYVEANTLLARVSLVTPPTEPLTVNIDTILYNHTHNELLIFSPIKGYVDAISYAEKSTVRPEEKFITLISSDTAVVSFFLPEDIAVTNFQKLTVTHQNSRVEDEIVLTSSTPVLDQNSDENVYAANFKDISNVRKFSNQEKVEIKAYTYVPSPDKRILNNLGRFVKRTISTLSQHVDLIHAQE